MKRLLSQFVLGLLVTIVVSSVTSAATRHWNSLADGVWLDAGNWSGNAIPVFADFARIGSLNGVKNSSVTLDQPANAERLWIQDGMMLINGSEATGDYFPLTVTGLTAISGKNFDGQTHRSTLRLYRGQGAYDLTSETVSINEGGRLRLEDGAIVNVTEALGTTPWDGSAEDPGRILGQGVINLSGSFHTLINNGVVQPLRTLGLTFNQNGNGTFNLDGDSEVGRVVIGDSLHGSSLTLNGSRLSDPFSGTVQMRTGRDLHMNLTDGWTADSNSTIVVGTDFPAGGAAHIRGSDLNLDGQLQLLDANGDRITWMQIDAGTTIGSTASVSLGRKATLEFHGNTTIDGGMFNFRERATTRFIGPTSVRGGNFIANSEVDPNWGVRFFGATDWSGAVNFEISARHLGDATVSGVTVINAEIFDMDGSDFVASPADWQVNSSLSINADSIDINANNEFNGTMTVGSGFLARASINLTNPADIWSMAGTLNLNNNLPFRATRLAGSKVEITGNLIADGAMIGIVSDAVLTVSSTTSFATEQSSLLFAGNTQVQAGATFAGVGTLQNQATGHFTLNDAASTDAAGLVNEGLLDIGRQVGIATVDRFENRADGTLAIDLAGYLLGEEFDHLMVAGEALLDGQLAVDFVPDVVESFLPVVGDEFMILTSLGGISGEFASVLPTLAGGRTYEWEAVYHPHDVTIRLASIGASVPEPASLALLTCGLIGLALGRSRRHPLGLIPASGGSPPAKRGIASVGALERDAYFSWGILLRFRQCEKRSRSARSLRSALLLVLLAASPAAAAVHRHWTSPGDGVWSDPGSWTGNVVPVFTERASIGAAAGVENSTVELDQPGFVDELDIEDGMSLFNGIAATDDYFPLTVAGTTTISGQNEAGPTNQSTLRLNRSPGAYDLSADIVRVQSRGNVVFDEGAIANIASGIATASAVKPGVIPGRVKGQGVVNLFGNAPATLVNDGILSPFGPIGLTFNQIGTGRFDLDGLSESGRVMMNSALGNTSLTLNGTGLRDTFGGELYLRTGHDLNFDLSDGWTADSESLVVVGSEHPAGGPSRIQGGHFTLEGELKLLDSIEDRIAWSWIEAPITINSSAKVQVGIEGGLQFEGQTTINGGEFTVEQNAFDLVFAGPTTVNGGNFTTHGKIDTTGAILFHNQTDWNGTVNIVGEASQIGDATVSGNTVINADRFDIDGNDPYGYRPTWQVNSSLVINATHLETATSVENEFNGTMNVASGFLSQAQINLTDPSNHWTMAGTLILNNNLPFRATRLAGSEVHVAGDLNADGTNIGIAADTIFTRSSTTSFATANSSLIMAARTQVESGALFVGEGWLENGPTGKLTLDNAVSTANVGLVNAGLLDIDDEIGVATVDRFENLASATLALDLAGHVLGDEFDHLIIDGDATLGGTLAVDLFLDEAGVFSPAAGDEFMIIQSLGGVSGEFANVPSTLAGGQSYEWEAIYHPHDVTLKLASVTSVPEPASLLLFACGMLGMLVGRRRRSDTQTCHEDAISDDQSVQRSATRTRHALTRFCGSSLAVLALFFSTLAEFAYAQPTYTMVALSGLPVPGAAPGVNFDYFGRPQINAVGDVIMSLGISGPGINSDNNGVIFVGNAGEGSLVAQQGDLPPGYIGNVSYSGTFPIMSLSSTGQVSFSDRLEGDGVPVFYSAYFSENDEVLEVTAFNGDNAPSTGAGVNYELLAFQGANNQGQLAFSVNLVGPGIHFGNNSAVYSEVGESLHLIAREGDPAPGSAMGTNFEGFGLPLISESGETVFSTNLNNGQKALYVYDAVGIEPLLFTSDPVPGAPAGTTFSHNSFSRYQVNNSGHIAFDGVMRSGGGVLTGEGIYTNRSGALQPVVVTGDPTPGITGNIDFEEFENLLLNDAGDVAFHARLEGTLVFETNNDVLYKEESGLLELVTRQGQLVPDVTDSARFGELEAFYFNNTGQVALLTNLQGPSVDHTNDTALFAEMGGQLRLVARAGDLFDVDPDPLIDDLREIEFIASTNSDASSNGGRSPLNDAGQLAFSLNFTDDSHGTFVANLGLPGDFNGSSLVEGADFLHWQRALGDAENLEVWEANYGEPSIAVSAIASHLSVPEPTSFCVLTVILAFITSSRNLRFDTFSSNLSHLVTSS